jgi:hypothetical protein
MNVNILHYKAELQPRVEIRQTGSNALLAFVPSRSVKEFMIPVTYHA